ncbi:FecR family protein [Sinomicrobium oceani]|uniref:FecR family protein n=1 Tax=Sinomicrobium oceani TaxID=1150368 RepID=A0A1K1MAT1_9FLAO|nr:FecR family protein [Sinomicrobium oceani]SFW20232.1 FecR family protein [Sinomicrobium oceani]
MESDRNGILQKYFSGRCTSEEKQFVEEFILNKDNVLLEGYLSSEWVACAEKRGNPVSGADDRYKRISKRIHKNRGTDRRRVWSVAASIIALLGITTYFLMHLFYPVSGKQIIVSTGAGQQREVILPDSTVVWLNCVSSITYPEYFSGDYREVKVKGEALFEVTKNPHRPFVVNFNEHYTKVLGTVFTVRSYPGEYADMVTLVEGSVAVGEKQPDDLKEYTVLIPGERITISDSIENNFSKSRIQEVASVASWKSGELRFYKTPLDMVAKDLERWYGKDIVLERQGQHAVDDNMTLTSIIKPGTRLEEVLEILSLTHRISYTRTENKIVITSK